MYPDSFDPATFSFRIKKFPRPHVAYSIEFACPQASDGIRIYSRETRPYWFIFTIRDDTILRRHRIRKYPDSPVHSNGLLRPHNIGFIADKKYANSLPNSLNACGRWLRILARISVSAYNKQDHPASAGKKYSYIKEEFILQKS